MGASVEKGERVVQELRRRAARGHPLNSGANRGDWLYAAAMLAFGSWERAIEASGFAYDDIKIRALKKAGLLDAELGGPLAAMAMQKPEFLDDIRRSMQGKLREVQDSPAPSPTEHWTIAGGYEGIERAQLVVVNVHGGENSTGAEALVSEVARIRKDEDVFRDVLRFAGNKLPVTAVVADVASPKDAGMKKAIVRLKRAIKQAQR
jgi:hypothetical protein